MSSAPSDDRVPEPLRANTPEARVIKQKIWRACNVENQHFIGAIVGPEGSGKSLTAGSILEAADPSFDASRVMFDPAMFLKRLKKWKANDETKGKAVLGDEAGVGLGVRTWYEGDQIKFNQVLQVIRDENMAIIFTVPRLSELDSQTRGRIRGYMEMTDLEDGEWARCKYLNWNPTRDERDKIYRQYPQIRMNGFRRPIKRLCISPPSDEFVRDYQERKAEFQRELYDDTIEQMEEDVEDERSVRDVAMEIANGGMDEIVSIHAQNRTPYINKSLIRVNYELSKADAQAVKSLLEQQFNKDDLEEYV